MVDDGKSRKIMTKPLPQILDEIEDSIRKADEAAKTARDAALEARQSGETAFSEATKIADERITEVERIARHVLELAELLKEALTGGITTINRSLAGDISEPDETAET